MCEGCTEQNWVSRGARGIPEGARGVQVGYLRDA